MSEPSSARPPHVAPAALPPGPGERRRALVVDDEPGVCYVARRVLEPRFEVRDAGSAEDALRLLESEAFHFAIVDVRLPGISGLDLLATIKNLSPRTDVIVMTGSAVDVDEALEGAIRRRAFFFLRKPFPMTILETLAARVAEKQELEEQLDRYTRTLERTLESARVFQRRLLPPADWRGDRIRLASIYEPSERLGGDLVDYWSLPTGGTALLVVDVMGHGPLAAMLTAVVKSQIHSLASEIHDPGEVLASLEEELRRIALPGFLSCLLVFDRPDEGEISWAGGGHPPALLWTPEGENGDGRRRTLPSEGLLLNTGLPPRPRASRVIPRTPGSRLLLFTDGYPEAADPDGRHFDDEHDALGPDPGAPSPDSPFGRAVEQALRAPDPAAAIGILEAERRRFVRDTPPSDDRAAVIAFLT